MLKSLKRLFDGETAQKTASPADDTDTRRAAIAALLVVAARSDEAYTLKERRIIDQAVETQFGLDADAVKALVDEAESAASEALDLHQFTKYAKQLPEGEKIALVETLWRVVLSDDERDPYEDAFMRRLCGLIYVSDRQSGEARQRVSRSNEDI